MKKIDSKNAEVTTSGVKKRGEQVKGKTQTVVVNGNSIGKIKKNLLYASTLQIYTLMESLYLRTISVNTHTHTHSHTTHTHTHTLTHTPHTRTHVHTHVRF